MSTNQFNPKRRQDGIRIEEFQGELLVYDLSGQNAHCLNGAAAQVWQYADGTMSAEEIAARIARDSGSEPDEALVWRALEELDRAKLLATPIEASSAAVSRRQLFIRLGWAAAVPLVLSIAVPTPAYAQSGTI